MPRAAVLVLGAATAACSADTRVEVSLPALAGARTAVVVADQGDVRTAWLYDLEATNPSFPALTDLAPIHLSVAGFAEAPAHFGLGPGAIPAGGARTLEALPTAVFEATVEDEAPAWSRLTALPPALSTLRVPGEASPCATFTPRPFGGLGGRDSGGVLIALDDRTVLGSLRDGVFFRLTLDGVTPLPALTGLPAFVGHRADDGGLWLFGAAGRAASGTLDGGFTERASAPTPSELVALTPVPGSTLALDLFVLSARGELFRFDGERWTRLSDPDGSDTQSRTVAAASARDVVFTMAAPTLHRWDGATRRTLAGVTEDVREFEAVTYLPELGYVGGTTLDGRFYQLTASERWERVRGAEGQLDTLGLSVDTLLPLDGGWFASGNLGATLQWVPGFGYCPRAAPVSTNSLSRSVRVGRDVVLLGETGVGIDAGAVWLVRQ